MKEKAKLEGKTEGRAEEREDVRLKQAEIVINLLIKKFKVLNDDLTKKIYDTDLAILLDLIIAFVLISNNYAKTLNYKSINGSGSLHLKTLL